MYIRPIQFTLNFAQQSSVVYTISFWPRFYYSIIKIKEKHRSLWETLKNPEPPNGPKADKRVVTIWQLEGADHLMRNKIVCLNKNMHCYSHYQVQGAYAHLNQIICQDLDEALAAACTIKYYDDPLHLAVPYLFFMDLIPEPPDEFVKSLLSLALILLYLL